MGYKSPKIDYCRKVLIKDSRRIHTSIISHVNSNDSNYLKTSDLDIVKRTLKCPYLTIQNDISSNSLVTTPKRINTGTNVFINDKRQGSNYINK